MPAAVHWTTRPAAKTTVSLIISQWREVAHLHLLPPIDPGAEEPLYDSLAMPFCCD